MPLHPSFSEQYKGLIVIPQDRRFNIWADTNTYVLKILDIMISFRDHGRFACLLGVEVYRYIYKFDIKQNQICYPYCYTTIQPLADYDFLGKEYYWLDNPYCDIFER